MGTLAYFPLFLITQPIFPTQCFYKYRVNVIILERVEAFIWVERFVEKSSRCDPGSQEAILCSAGALFEPEHDDLDLVLKYAVRRVNQRRDLLPITALSSNVLTAPLDDSFTMAQLRNRPGRERMQYTK